MLQPIYVKDAWSIVSRYDSVPKVLEVSPEKSVGYVTAEDVVSDVNYPKFHRAAMDGIAVRSDDTRSLTVFQREPIMTGRPLPSWADAVVPKESYHIEGNMAILDRPVHKRENVDILGSDVSEGDVLLPKGTRIKPHHVSALALLGRPVKVATIEFTLIVVGSEIKPFGEINDIDGPMVSALLRLYGGSIAKVIRVPDDERKIEEALKEALKYERPIITTGGTSVGDKDLVPKVISRLGEVLVHGIKAKPCKPFTFSDISGIPVFSLPGPPVACFIAADVFVGPWIRKILESKAERIRLKRRGILGAPIASKPDRRDYVRLIIKNGLLYPTGSGAGRIVTLYPAVGYMEIEESLEGVDKGQEVERFDFRYHE